ncbi:hypothetical protein [Lacihabitans lacunae]|uniref:ABC transporter permease n=1 Tax=Lacihabitans lacunae TaxID=1028214 RepID=A0ABV7YWI7_9BACT
MKLTNKQITEIENYISSWNLVYKEVYDEMLDHYCSEIETQMEKGIDYYSAFTDAHRQFENLEQKVSYGEITEVYGLKALESSQYSAIDKKIKKEYFKFSLKHLLSFRIVFWIFFTIFQYKVLYSQFEELSFNDSKISFWGGFCLGITYPFLAAVLSNSSLVDNLKNTGIKHILNLIYKKDARFEIRKIAILKLLIFPLIIVLLFFQSYALFQIPITKTSLTLFGTLFTYSLSTIISYLIQTKLFIKDINILKVQF